MLVLWQTNLGNGRGWVANPALEPGVVQREGYQRPPADSIELLIQPQGNSINPMASGLQLNPRLCSRKIQVSRAFAVCCLNRSPSFVVGSLDISPSSKALVEAPRKFHSHLVIYGSRRGYDHGDFFIDQPLYLF